MRMQASKKRRFVIAFLAQLCLVLATGAATEFLYNLPLKKEQDYQYLEESQIQTDGFKLTDGVYVSEEGGASLTLTFPKQYVDKLYYEFDYEGQLYATVYVGDYSKEDSSPDRKIEDHNNHLSNSSTVNIRCKTDRITIRMPQEAR